ncbi:MAG: S9 family peptidase [Acidobacteriota bacterium]|nr:S9 family peptidase [Acidobacteriota bacterium]
MFYQRFLSVFAAALFCALLAAPVTAVERVERGNLVIEGIPEIPQEVEDQLQRYQNARSANLQGWHPTGEGVLISTRFGETSQVHWVREPGAARQQITFFDEPVGGAEPSPTPKTEGFLFQKDVGGGEFFQIFYFDLKTGKYRLLSDGESLNGSTNWAHDGERYAFYSTRRNGQDWDVYLGDINKPGEEELLLERGGAWVVGGFSPDDKKIIVAQYISANETNPYILDLATKELTPIDDADEPVAYSGVSFAADGKGVYFASDRGTEFKHLRYKDLESGETRILTEDIPWDVGQIEISPDGKHIAFVVNADGLSELHVRKLPGLEPVKMPELPTALIYSLRFDAYGQRLAFNINSSQSPGDVHSLELATGKLTRWTFSEVGGLDVESFSVPQLVRFPTFDEVDGESRTIPAFYYQPSGPGPHPVVIDIHGGPEGQERPGFSPFTQFLVQELGVAMIAPNVRGSSGYGKSYLQLDNGMKREDSVKDIGALLDWIETQPELDSERVAVFGGSYGGYMVLASMVHYDDRLKAGVDIVGISNFVTFLENTQDYRRDLRRVEYGDERDPEMRAFLEKISPTNHAEKISNPLLVVQGLNDPRVPASESEQMVEEIRDNGGEVWYLLAKDEGHGFRKKSNRDYFLAATALFLDRYLIGDDEAEEPAAAR